jgi:acetylglutamate kinase
LPTILVHGGGKEISQLQQAFQIEPRYIDGLRVTDEVSLNLVKMALIGAVNSRLVELFNDNGIEAQGLSGLDRGLLRAVKLQHPKGDLLRTGEVTQVRGELLLALLQANVLPVIAPLGLGEDGAFNVNADYVAGAIGQALQAERVVFLTNVPGVLQAGAVIPHLSIAQAQQLIAEGVIAGGMIPKVQTALEVVQRGAKQTLITDLEGLRQDRGTRFSASTSPY